MYIAWNMEVLVNTFSARMRKTLIINFQIGNRQNGQTCAICTFLAAIDRRVPRLRHMRRRSFRCPTATRFYSPSRQCKAAPVPGVSLILSTVSHFPNQLHFVFCPKLVLQVWRIAFRQVTHLHFALSAVLTYNNLYK